MKKTLAIFAALIGLVMAAPAAALDYNLVEGDSTHNWTNDGRHNHVPPCSESRPCTEDLKGTSGADKIVGYGGWDYIRGLGGNDLLLGGRWMDQYYGGEGNDVIRDTQGGHDHAWGSEGDDTINVSDGHDEVDRVEEVRGDLGDGPQGIDTCTLDNDPGDLVKDCEHITVINDDGSRITFDPRIGVPDGVRVTVRP